MARVTEVAEQIYEIFPEDPRVGVACCCYLVVDEQTALIETGSSSQVDEILEGMAKLGYGAESLSFIIPTHIHVDHGGGAGYLAQKADRAKVVAHPKGAPHFIDPSKLSAGSSQIFGNDFETHFGSLLPVPEARIHIAKDGETISLGQRGLKIIHTPGHCSDHIAIHDSKSHGLFCGEALGGYLPMEDRVLLAVSPPVFLFDAALAGIKKIKSMEPSHLFYSQWGHGKNPGVLLDRIEAHLNACGEMIRQGLASGESEEILLQKARPYILLDDQYIDSPSLRKTFGSFGIQPMVAYFRNKGEN